MNISFETVNNILQTLPIGYYAKREVPTELSETADCSYYIPVQDKIVISYSQLSKSFDSLNESFDIESAIRTMLYHEVSHAILSPKTLSITNYVNIIEDERIETLLNDFYKDVQFKKLVFAIAKHQGLTPKNAEHAFWLYVRCHLVYEPLDSKYWLYRLSSLINRYKTISTKQWLTTQYQNECADLYYDFIDSYKTTDAKESSESTDSSSTSESTDSSSDTSEESLNDIQIDDMEQSDEPIEESSTSAKSASMNEDDLPKLDVDDVLIDTVIEKSNIFKTYDKSVSDELYAIFAESNKITKQTSSAINAYSGIFDPRSVVRDDYKYFLQKNREGHKKAYSKMHLNLFIDCSGSFRNSDDIINTILTGLVKVEKINPNFSFDLISCGMKNTLRDKNDRVQFSRGGNCLDESIIPVYEKVQHRDATNVNVVCFDGDAWSDVYDKTTAMKSISIWNNMNSIIISSPDNATAFNKYCPVPKKIFTYNYTDNLYKSIIDALRILVK